jgi:hypothetical protein
MKPASREAMLDRTAAEAQLRELAPRDHATLASGERSDHLVGARVSYCLHLMQ